MKKKLILSVGSVLFAGLLLTGCTQPSSQPSHQASKTSTPTTTSTSAPTTSGSSSTSKPSASGTPTNDNAGRPPAQIVKDTWPVGLPTPDISQIKTADYYKGNTSGQNKSILVTTKELPAADLAAYAHKVQNEGKLEVINTYEVNGASVQDFENDKYTLEIMTVPVGNKDNPGFEGTTRYKIVYK